MPLHRHLSQWYEKFKQLECQKNTSRKIRIASWKFLGTLWLFATAINLRFTQMRLPKKNTVLSKLITCWPYIFLINSERERRENTQIFKLTLGAGARVQMNNLHTVYTSSVYSVVWDQKRFSWFREKALTLAIGSMYQNLHNCNLHKY